nr:MAG TPA: hypothetical protein [Caudoviricetes sp.]
MQLQVQEIFNFKNILRHLLNRLIVAYFPNMYHDFYRKR